MTIEFLDAKMSVFAIFTFRNLCYSRMYCTVFEHVRALRYSWDFCTVKGMKETSPISENRRRKCNMFHVCGICLNIRDGKIPPVTLGTVKIISNTLWCAVLSCLILFIEMLYNLSFIMIRYLKYVVDRVSCPAIFVKRRPYTVGISSKQCNTKL